jgi:hypothetical protein
MFGQFLVPFFILLSQPLKRSTKVAVVAIWMMLMRWIDIYWLVYPNFPDTKGHWGFPWISVAVTAGIGGLWVAAFLVNLRAHPLVPAHAPLLDVILEEEHGH